MLVTLLVTTLAHSLEFKMNSMMVTMLETLLVTMKELMRVSLLVMTKKHILETSLVTILQRMKVSLLVMIKRHILAILLVITQVTILVTMTPTTKVKMCRQREILLETMWGTLLVIILVTMLDPQSKVEIPILRPIRYM